MLHRITFVVAVIALAAATAAYSASGSKSGGKTIKASLFFTGLTNVDADHNGKASVGDYAIAPGFFTTSHGMRMEASVPRACK